MTLVESFFISVSLVAFLDAGARGHGLGPLAILMPCSSYGGLGARSPSTSLAGAVPCIGTCMHRAAFM